MKRPNRASIAALASILLLLADNWLVTVSLGGPMIATLCVLMWEKNHPNPLLARAASDLFLLEFVALAICCLLALIGIL